MSEFPFDGSASDDDAGPPSRTRTFVLAGALVAALGVGGGVLLLGGSSGNATSAVALTPTVRQHSATPSATPAPTAAAVPVAGRVQGRNPYKALHVAATAAAPGTAPSGSPVAQPTATAAPTGSATPAVAYPLKLVKVTTNSSLGTSVFFDWLVDGVKVRTVNAQRFGKTGELVVVTVTRDTPTSGPYTAWVQAGADKPVEVLVGKTVQIP